MTNTAYVFDLDGVITNPENSQVNKDLLQHIHSLLSSNTLVAVNTGRSYDWVAGHLIAFLEGKEDATLFSNLVVVCEKGGELVTWTDRQSDLTPSKFALSAADYQTTKDVFTLHESELDTMFWDKTKRTMATIEKKPEAGLDEFHRQQAVLTEELRAAFASSPNIRIDATVIATDVESQEAGKYAGGEIIHEWMSAKAPIQQYICFGDSISDYAMAECFADHEIATTFVYVGKSADSLPNDERITLHLPTVNFDTGTLEFLSSHS
jgi:hydroxymethylpyrimidine pyrophosphatase-like HAD family hydrolase